MFCDLFSVFNPGSILGMNLNWLSVLAIMIFTPSYFWMIKSKPFYIFSYIFSYLNSEFSMALGSVSSQGLTHIFISIFLFISMNNFLGLFPYIFTPSSHLTFTVALALPLWVGYMTYSVGLNMGSFLTHLVPLGTPYVLMPFMVIIELVSSGIRPLTLAVRLAANMVAGHLLMVLVSSPMASISLSFILLVLPALLLLIMLELAVSFIQAYVFSTLLSLYVIEVNSPNL